MNYFKIRTLILEVLFLKDISIIPCWANDNTNSDKNSDFVLSEIRGVNKRNTGSILTGDHNHDFVDFTEKNVWLKILDLNVMAEVGAYMKNAFVTSLICSPGFVPIFTSGYTQVHPIVHNFKAIPDPDNLAFSQKNFQKGIHKLLGYYHLNVMKEGLPEVTPYLLSIQKRQALNLNWPDVDYMCHGAVGLKVETECIPFNKNEFSDTKNYEQPN